MSKSCQFQRETTESEPLQRFLWYWPTARQKSILRKLEQGVGGIYFWSPASGHCFKRWGNGGSRFQKNKKKRWRDKTDRRWKGNCLHQLDNMLICNISVFLCWLIFLLLHWAYGVTDGDKHIRNDLLHKAWLVCGEMHLPTLCCTTESTHADLPPNLT